ncbi:importin-9-like [Anneissia japonica]|uniref:importin-9-like n=1 Tax=Anneissia japonica TaxID=1529436 RepID=UPI0014256AA9|nr:importin-9-like [Anneissia japonica]
MAACGDVTRSICDHIIESLHAILSPEHLIRIQGEEQIKLLEVTEEFGVHLAELTLDPKGALAIRQLASVILKQYVECHWSQHADKFRPPEATEAAKADIRRMLPAGLHESISKVRSSIAYAISAIAHWDWPEAWPGLFDQLMHLITSGDANAVHGAMRVLTEFTREVTDMQMPNVAPVIMPEMYRIFTNAELYSIRTRGRAVEIFNTCALLIFSVNEVVKGLAAKLVYPLLPGFVEAFIQALNTPDGPISDSGLKMEVIKALTTLIKNYPKQMSKFMPQILPPIWKTLTESAAVYITTVVNGTEDADNPIDSDGEVLGFENLVFSVFDFINGMVETPKFRSTIKKSVDQLFYYIVLYMQITEEQVTVWSNNPNQFVEDEDDETFSYSVRISAQDLLLQLAAEFQTDSSLGLVSAVTRHFQEAQVAKENGNGYWWKIHESCLLALGSVKSLICDKVASGKLQFDMETFLTSVVLADLNYPVSPFLLGRALWAASRFTLAMTPKLVQSFLEATTLGLGASQPPSVRISAVRAIHGYCDHLKSSNNSQVLVPFLPNIMAELIELAKQSSSDVLALVMETISIAITIDPEFTASCEKQIAPLAIALFLKFSQDPIMASYVEDIFKELAANPGSKLALEKRLIPTIISVLNGDPEKLPMGIQSPALDILCTVVRSSGAPLSNEHVNIAFPAAAQCMLRSDDNAVMQSGGECLRAYVSVGLNQIREWHDPAGNDGISYITKCVSKLLNPQTSEFTAAFVGRLVAILISKVGRGLGDDLSAILKAVLSKMQQAETLSVVQSLVMVFAHLMHSQMDAVLDFLYQVPGPTGNTALEFVLTEWAARQHNFYGAYECKVSITALSELLKHFINTNDIRLDGIVVKGDEIFKHEGIRTRSKAAIAPDEWTIIPIQVKIYKILVNELSNVMEANISRQASAGGEDVEEEDGWDDDEDEDDEEDNVNDLALANQLADYVPSSSFMGYDFGEDVDDEEEDDPDALQDPVFQIDIQAHLTEFLQQLSHHPSHLIFASHLNNIEKHILSSIGIAIQ